MIIGGESCTYHSRSQGMLVPLKKLIGSELAEALHDPGIWGTQLILTDDMKRHLENFQTAIKQEVSRRLHYMDHIGV